MTTTRELTEPESIVGVTRLHKITNDNII